MKIRIATFAAAALATPLLATIPAQADPAMMTHAEWSNVNEGETKANVEAACSCSGQKNGLTYVRNGNTYTDFNYLTPVGEAFVYYRVGADGKWHVGFRKFWCPDWNGYVETGDCAYVDFG